MKEIKESAFGTGRAQKKNEANISAISFISAGPYRKVL